MINETKDQKIVVCKSFQFCFLGTTLIFAHITHAICKLNKRYVLRQFMLNKKSADTLCSIIMMRQMKNSFFKGFHLFLKICEHL